MNNAVAIKDDFDLSKNYFLLNNLDSEQRTISKRQYRILTNLILEKIQDEDERENWFLQIDEMTEAEARNTISEFLA